MRIALLTHAEAADPAVLANIARHLLGDAHSAIAYIDRPDVGAPELPLPTRAAQVFGAAPSTAVAAALPTAPGTSIPPVPAAAPPAPPPAPAAAAPVPPAPPAPPAAPALPDTSKLDSRGLPWDSRIHASSKTTNKADGQWRQKRETPDALVQQVEAELRQVMGLPAPTPATPPVPPVPNSAFAVAAAMGLAPPVDLGSLMVWVAPFMPHKITNDQLMAALAQHGVPSLNALVQRPDLVPAIHAALVPLSQ